jgi:hypothetical protein
MAECLPRDYAAPSASSPGKQHSGIALLPRGLIREATARHRKRRERGLFLRPILVTKGQLDQLEMRGYLDSNKRGDRADEREAIETFFVDSLNKP